MSFTQTCGVSLKRFKSKLQSRGRLNRSRLEWFFQTAVQAETSDNIDIDRLYAGYRGCVDSQPGLSKAGEQLAF